MEAFGDWLIMIILGAIVVGVLGAIWPFVAPLLVIAALIGLGMIVLVGWADWKKQSLERFAKACDWIIATGDRLEERRRQPRP